MLRLKPKRKEGILQCAIKIPSLILTSYNANLHIICQKSLFIVVHVCVRTKGREQPSFVEFMYSAPFPFQFSASFTRSAIVIATVILPHTYGCTPASSQIYDYHTVLVSCAISQSKCLANYSYATCSSIVAVERSRSSPKATRFSCPVQFIRRPRFRSLRNLFTILRD